MSVENQIKLVYSKAIGRQEMQNQISLVPRELFPLLCCPEKGTLWRDLYNFNNHRLCGVDV